MAKSKDKPKVVAPKKESKKKDDKKTDKKAAANSTSAHQPQQPAPTPKPVVEELLWEEVKFLSGAKLKRYLEAQGCNVSDLNEKSQLLHVAELLYKQNGKYTEDKPAEEAAPSSYNHMAKPREPEGWVDPIVAQMQQADSPKTVAMDSYPAPHKEDEAQYDDAIKESQKFLDDLIATKSQPSAHESQEENRRREEEARRKEEEERRRRLEEEERLSQQRERDREKERLRAQERQREEEILREKEKLRIEEQVRAEEARKLEAQRAEDERLREELRRDQEREAEQQRQDQARRRQQEEEERRRAEEDERLKEERLRQIKELDAREEARLRAKAELEEEQARRDVQASTTSIGGGGATTVGDLLRERELGGMSTLEKAAKEGYLLKLGSGMFSKWQSRWVRVAGGKLMYYRSHTDDLAKPRATIVLINSEIKVIPETRFKRKYVIGVVTEKREYQFACETEDDLTAWMTVLHDERRPIPTKPAGNPFSLESLKGLATTSVDPRESRRKSAMPQPRVTGDDNLDDGYDNAKGADRGDWNSKYQTVLEEPEQTFDQSVDKGLKLAELTGQFVEKARGMSKLLIDEYFVPAPHKSVSPCNLDLQTSQGSDLYISEGVLLRIVEDRQGEQTYNTADEAAIKIAGHELKGWQAYNEVAFGAISLPLALLVDYKGFRVLATSIPPIDGARTMIYGSQDGLVRRHEAAAKILKDAAEKLHLKEHLVACGPGQTMNIHTSSELQVHCGDDNRMYAINLTRVFPPDVPERNTEEVLTKLLRPEFVMRYGKKLSSDAWSGHLSDLHDQEASEASAYLHSHVMKQFIHKLDLLEVFPIDSEQLTNAMHAEGINVRYMASLAQHSKLPYIQHLAAVEMVARSCKRLLNKSIRAIQRAELEHGRTTKVEIYDCDRNVRVCVVDFFNLVLGNGVESDAYWDNIITKEVFIYFKHLVKRGTIHLPALFLAMQWHIGVEFDDIDHYAFGRAENPIHVDELIQLETKIKLPQEKALECNRVAEKADEYRLEGKHEEALQAYNLQLALLKKTKGVSSNECVRVLNNLATTHIAMGKFDHAELCANAALGIARRFHAETAHVYMNLIEINFQVNNSAQAFECYNHAQDVIIFHYGSDHPLLMKVHSTMGKMFYQKKQYDGAVDYYTKALDLSTRLLGNSHPTSAFYCNKVGHIYRAWHDYDKALQMYERALLINETILGPNSSITAYSYFYMSEVLLLKGQLNKGLDYANKAANIRLLVYGDSHPLTLASYYQVAFAADKLDKVEMAILYFEKLLRQLRKTQQKAVGTDKAVVDEIQRVTRAIIRLKIKSLPVGSRDPVNRARIYQKTSDLTVDLMKTVISRLYDESPSTYLDVLFKEGSSRSESAARRAQVELAGVIELLEGFEDGILVKCDLEGIPYH